MNWWQKHQEWMTERGWVTTHLGHLQLYGHLQLDGRPVRRAKAWSWHHGSITCGRDLRASLRAGFVSWPGCYPVMFLTNDCEWVCPHCVIKDYRRCIQDIRDRSFDRIVALTSTSDLDPDPMLVCRDCGLNPWKDED